MIAFPIFNTWAEPGGTYILTGKEKGVSEIIISDMEKHPSLYEGESLNNYASKFKKENRIGKRKLAPGDELIFPDTLASIKLRKSTANAKPAATGKEPELIVEDTGSITLTAAWLTYGGSRTLWITEKFAETYPEAESYRYTFAEEVDSKTALITIWKQLGGESKDPYLDNLVKIEEKGYLDEYVWQTDRTEGWEEPKNLKMDNYKRWAQKNIPNHKPECRITIK